jgi:hypothetical protein
MALSRKDQSMIVLLGLLNTCTSANSPKKRIGDSKIGL